MAKTMLQIPMDASLKMRATAAARAMGFSSLQELIRVMLMKLARRELVVEFRDIKTGKTKIAAHLHSK